MSRKRAACVVAQVPVNGSADQAGNRAFPILAGYIFGKHEGARKYEMTAPVTRAATAMQLEMTATVTQAAVAAAGGCVVQFVLPKSVTLASALEPIDPQVQLPEVPSSRHAVMRCPSFWSQSNCEEHLGKLDAALRAAKVAWTGEPTLSRYDAPFTPWFKRQNEMWLTLASVSLRDGTR